MGYIYLALAIFTEVIASSSIKATKEFTVLFPSIVVLIGFGLSFYFMALTLRYIPLGITYAVWSGVGIVVITAVGVVAYKEIPDLPALLGMGFIIAGVLIIHLFSNTISH